LSYLEISTSINIEGKYTLPGETQVAIYRIAQEVFNNIVKHANATCVDVNFVNRGNSVHLSISDNGKGFCPDELRKDRFGLKIIQERAESINAQVEFYSREFKGTIVTLDWPTPSNGEGFDGEG
jgi:signal transduction histidine kinase